MVRKRETLMPNQKLMLLLKPMPITVMEAMEADMADTVMVDMEDTDMAVNADLLSLDTDMADMVVMEDTDMEVMDMEDMGTMVDSIRKHKHGCTLVTVNKKQKLRRVLASVVEVM